MESAAGCHPPGRLDRDGVTLVEDGVDYVVYDLSRLISRGSCRIATGIDRIDLHFALGQVRRFGADCRFVTKVGSKAVEVPREVALPLLQALEEVWLHGGESDLSPLRRLERGGYAERISASGGAVSRVLRDAASYLRRWLLNSLRPQIPGGLLGESGRRGCYIVCSHHGLPKIPGVLERLQRESGLGILAYIHDIIPIEYPEYMRPGHVGIFRNYLHELDRAGASFVVNSRDTARRLDGYLRPRSGGQRPVRTLYPCLDLTRAEREPTDPRVIAARKSETPYFVVVGTIEPRKNHLLLLHIWRQLAQSGWQPMPHLHIVGRRGWENENIIDMLERCNSIRPHISEHNALGDADLIHLLKGARALLFPSFAEGLGLPLLEAVELGVPVVASNLPVFREIGSEVPYYIDPIDGPGWAQAIRRLSREPPLSGTRHQTGAT